MSPVPPGRIDPRLVERIRAAGHALVWTELAEPGPGRRSWTVALRDESTRVEERDEAERRELRVDSGPVGALVLLLRIDAAGPPHELGVHAADASGPFPDGSLSAAWGTGPAPPLEERRWRDLVDLARYALR